MESASKKKNLFFILKVLKSVYFDNIIQIMTYNSTKYLINLVEKSPLNFPLQYGHSDFIELYLNNFSVYREYFFGLYIPINVFQIIV